uniref:Uncharacterized protein n=1 Tax=Glossina austeni TaxID=7395 RepID=A0A1A9VLP6_GLOAU
MLYITENLHRNTKSGLAIIIIQRPLNKSPVTESHQILQVPPDGKNVFAYGCRSYRSQRFRVRTFKFHQTFFSLQMPYGRDTYIQELIGENHVISIFYALHFTVMSVLVAASKNLRADLFTFKSCKMHM